MAKRINSWMNETIVRLANHGVQGKTCILKFQARKRDTGKSLVTRECPKCEKDGAVVFQSFERKDIYLLACPRCKKFSYPDLQGDKVPAAPPAPDVKDAEKDTEEVLCAGVNKDGSPCRKHPQKGSLYCYTHRGQAPSSDAEVPSNL